MTVIRVPLRRFLQEPFDECSPDPPEWFLRHQCEFLDRKLGISPDEETPEEASMAAAAEKPLQAKKKDHQTKVRSAPVSEQGRSKLDPDSVCPPESISAPPLKKRGPGSAKNDFWRLRDRNLIETAGHLGVGSLDELCALTESEVKGKICAYCGNQTKTNVRFYSLVRRLRILGRSFRSNRRSVPCEQAVALD